jgi:hypothetical protein
MAGARGTIHRTLFPGILLAAALANGQGPGGRGAPPPAPPLGTIPKAAVPNAKPVRTCESLAMVPLPNTIIESATVDPNSPGICRVAAITTHPPANDKVRIWLGVPTSNSQWILTLGAFPRKSNTRIMHLSLGGSRVIS